MFYFMSRDTPGTDYKFQISLADTFAMEVEKGKSYLMRIVNAALNDELFFTIANHTFNCGGN